MNLQCKKFMGVMLFFLIQLSMSLTAQAQNSIYNSPYVTFSPDGKAWTTNAGNQQLPFYNSGTTVSTGIPSSMRELKTGEHYYINTEEEMIPVGYWKVYQSPVCCIHLAGHPAGYDYHGIAYKLNLCYRAYGSGWISYCADCGERIAGMVYMDMKTLKTLDYLPAESEYYYLCPFCKNLEQGIRYSHHCNKISSNRYLIRYNPNAVETEGKMQDDIFLYNNASEYEGHKIPARTELTPNQYTRPGYEFVCWNTKPDGSGVGYRDGTMVMNLTTENWQDGSSEGIVTLYAQWEKKRSILQIDPCGGTYAGRDEITQVEGDFGDIYRMDSKECIPPTGHRATFQTEGGSPVADIYAENRLEEWQKKEPFAGFYENNQYYFCTAQGTTDTLSASYQELPIQLPCTQQEGYVFEGWYRDGACTQFAGHAGDSAFLSQDTCFYAKWKERIPDLELEVSLSRLLEPHDPVFKGGESGILSIKAGGYPDKILVEFPAQMISLNPSLNTEFVYPEHIEFQVTEEVRFMVPLYTPQGSNLPVKVTAYRSQDSVDKTVYCNVTSDWRGVLEEFRTRLR